MNTLDWIELRDIYAFLEPIGGVVQKSYTFGLLLGHFSTSNNYSLDILSRIIYRIELFFNRIIVWIGSYLTKLNQTFSWIHFCCNSNFKLNCFWYWLRLDGCPSQIIDSFHRPKYFHLKRFFSAYISELKKGLFQVEIFRHTGLFKKK